MRERTFADEQDRLACLIRHDLALDPSLVLLLHGRGSGLDLLLGAKYRDGASVANQGTAKRVGRRDKGLPSSHERAEKEGTDLVLSLLGGQLLIDRLVFVDSVLELGLLDHLEQEEE